jgi:cytochrome d ubiquinol oxidase subunit I
MEAQFASERGAPLRIGGWPNEAEQRTRFALEIPRGLSLLAYHDPNALVRGLNDFARENWPPVRIVHAGFQVMVGLGSVMAIVAIWALAVAVRRRSLRFESTDRLLLLALAVIAQIVKTSGESFRGSSLTAHKTRRA